MPTGYSGTYVAAWAQTALDGHSDAPVAALCAGAQWTWSGQARRVDGPDHILTLTGALGRAELHRRAARSVRRLLGTNDGEGKSDAANQDEVTFQPRLNDDWFVVTNGAQGFRVLLVESVSGGAPLVAFCDGLPPQSETLWVAQVNRRAPGLAGPIAPPLGLVEGTPVETPQGSRPIETLRPSDLVLTETGKAEPVLWAGHRRMSGARLLALPALRPIWLRTSRRSGWTGNTDILVAPGLHLAISGRDAENLFGPGPVLMAARDVMDDLIDLPAPRQPALRFCHLLLPRHALIRAGGGWVESLHPWDVTPGSYARPDLLDYDRAISRACGCAARYGPPVLRRIGAGNAAVLRARAA